MPLDILKYEFSVEQKEVNSVSARDLHRELGVGKDFSNWIKDRIAKYDFIEGKDFVKSIVTKNGDGESRGFQPIEYFITLSMAKEISMAENNEKGKVARKYFIECEEKLKQLTSPTQQPQIMLPSTQAATVISDVMQVAALFNVPTHLAQIESVNMAKKSTGFDYAPLLALSPMQDNIQVEEMMLEVTPLSEKLGIGTGKSGGAKLNKILAALELQVKEGKTWVATASATGKFMIHSANENAWSGYNMKWNVAFVTKLLKDKGYI